MNRMAVNLKQGQHVIMPSGKAAKLVHISADELVFEYFETHERCVLSRATAAKWWPV